MEFRRVLFRSVKLVTQEIQTWLHNSSHPWLIWLIVIPICLATGALLLYIAFKPLLDERRLEQTSLLPHGTAVDLSSESSPVYKRIAVSIDFSSVDAKTIQSAVAQGGLTATYLLLHVTESAGAMWYGSEIADKEADADAQALEDYAVQLRERGYQSEIKVGYG